MVTLVDKGVHLVNGAPVAAAAKDASARGRTMAYGILRAHSAGGDTENARIRFDALISHDITYCGIIQTARASGLTEFPLPYALTNCHNSLCAVVVLIDGAAHCAQGIVAVGEHVGDGEFGKSARARGLDDADIGNVVRSERVEPDTQLVHTGGGIVL